jgi:hypothetical protein
MPTPFEVRKAAFGSDRYWRGRAGIGGVSSPGHLLGCPAPLDGLCDAVAFLGKRTRFFFHCDAFGSSIFTIEIQILR